MDKPNCFVKSIETSKEYTQLKWNSIVMIKLEGESLLGEKHLLQSELSTFINQVTIKRIELKRRLKGIEEELRLVKEVKINEYSNLAKMKLATCSPSPLTVPDAFPPQTLGGLDPQSIAFVNGVV